ncbi:MAG: pantetheine-phosphate adenylyltransferase [Spirochaetota bacterium]
MLKAILPGSFDPPTNGHINIIQRASQIFDEIELVISINVQKAYLFSPDERFKMMHELVAEYKNIKVYLWDRLIVDFAEKMNVRVIIRGVRALDDFSHEFELSMMNKSLNPNIETLLIPTDPQYFVLRSSAIKELAVFNGDISKLVPPIVEKALKVKLRNA